MSHCFQRRFKKELEELEIYDSISVSYEITSFEIKRFQQIGKIIAKVIIPFPQYHLDVILYMNEYYPFKPPEIIIRQKILNEFETQLLNENILQHIFQYTDDSNELHQSIQSYICQQMDMLCYNRDEKTPFLEWKYNFDRAWFNHYVASSRLKDIIPSIHQMMELVNEKKVRLIPQV